MGLVLFVLLLAIPVLELWVIVQVADGIGVLNTLGLLIAISVLGAWLLKQQGVATWRRLQDTLRRGQMPANEVTDGAMILLGGALLLTPGFISDVVGIVLLLPPTRASLRGVARRVGARWARKRMRVERGATVRRVEKVERDAAVREARVRSSRSPLGDGRTNPSDGSRDTR